MNCIVMRLGGMTGASPVTTIHDVPLRGLPREFVYSSDALYGCHDLLAPVTLFVLHESCIQ